MDTEKDVNILVCCHKKDFCYSGSGYLPIQVGKGISSVDLGIQGDNTGDNISNKNPNYCELTAHYWLWKNGTSAKYVGLNHYRRYFAFGGINSGGYFFQNVSESEVNDKLLEIPSNIDEILKTHDIILAKPYIYPFPLEIHYAIAHSKNDLKALREVIESLYPDFVESFDEFMKGNKVSLCNMFVMRKETFDDYSKWLFDILFELEKKIKIPKDPYQSRIFGFMAERLLNVYVLKNRMKTKYLPIIKISDESRLSSIKGQLRNFMNNISYKIIKGVSDGKILYD